MPTTFNWIFLGTSTTFIDPTEGNSSMETFNAFRNQSFGSATDPLYGRIAQATMIDNGGTAGALDTNNSASNDQFLTDIGGGPQTFTYDGLVVYNATLTYMDGTTASVTAVIVQSTTGEIFLAPELNLSNADGINDTAAFQAKPIQSILLGTAASYTSTNLGADRVATGWDNGWIDGSAGNDLIDASYAEPVAFGSDRVDNNDGLNAASRNDDSIRAGTGDDTVYAGLGNDVVWGGTGNDRLYGEAGHDTLHGEAGNDSLTGGAGNDSLIAGDGADTLDGGDGDDTLDGGDGDDSLSSGVGNDLLYGGFGNDTIYFGEGDDTVHGGDGDDLIDDAAGVNLTGVNLIYGGAGNDTVWSGFGNDTLWGEAGNDVLSGEDGDDSLDGGSGNDTLSGGAGRDVLVGGSGADVLDGGADEDTIFGDIGDTVTGGGSGIDLDVLDLTAWGKALTNIYKDPGNPENGYVEFLDSFGAVIGTMSFSEIETIIPCFTPGTLIRTARGEVPVESLRAGDLVATRDHGLQPLRWVGRKTLSLAQLVVSPALRPVRLAAGSLGPARPSRDMLVSPQHRMLIEGARAEMLFGEPEVLVAAAHLAGRPGVDMPVVRSVTYIHLMFDRHEILWSDGTWSESFQPAARMVQAMDRARAEEVLALFPDLALRGEAFPAARLTLKAHEARVLLAA